MKIHIKILILITIIATAFTTIACNNDLKPATTYYTVTFDSNGGTKVASQTVESGKTAVEPRSPTKSGYNFTDWYNGSRVFDFSTTITSDITLVAKWTKIQSEDNKPTDNDNPDNEKPEENNNKTNEDKTPPAEVSDFTATPNHKRIVLNWTNPADEDFASVEITYADTTVEGNLSEPQIIQGNPSEQQSFTITNLENDKIYKITIKTIDSSNNKSTGIAKTASPKESKLSLEVSLPNDNGETVILTNDKATINVSISSTDQIVKAVWKKGNLYDAAALLSDETASILQTDSNTTSFTVNENGFYTISVKNAEGITECIQTQIKTIDKTPLSEVTNLITEGDGQNIYVTWTNPTPQDKYDSPLKNVIVSYVYNDDESDAANGEITLGSGITTATIPIADGKTEDDFVRIIVKVIDDLGNTNTGLDTQGYCCRYILFTNENTEEIITSITKDTKLIAKGTVTASKITTAIRKFQEDNPNIRIDLDLSNIESFLDSYIYLDFHNCFCLKKLEIPDILKNKYSFNFQNCVNLSEITIPGTVNNFDWQTFNGSSKINTIKFKGSLEQWCTKPWESYLISSSYDLYIDNKKVTYVEIPNNITNIGRAFRGCSSLTSITIPNSIPYLESSAFSYCTNLTNISLPANMESIGSLAFSNCTNLENITIPKGITAIDDLTFYNCSTLETIILPDTVNSIGDGAFEYCLNLKNITIPNGVTKIEHRTFSNCSSLHNLIIPNSITDIGEEAFSESGLTSLVIPDSVTNIARNAFYNCLELEEITIPDNPITIEDGYAPFSYCSNIKKITIGKSVLEKGLRAFFSDSLSNLSEIIILEGVTEINENFYSGRQSLTSITLPASVTKIGKYSFKDCINLSSITITENVSSLQWNAFEGSENITKINFIGTLENWCTKNWKTEYISSSYDLYINNQKITEIKNDSVNNMNSEAFNGCSSLITLNIPNNTTSMILKNCSNLETVSIPNSIKTISLINCPSVTSITIPDGIEELNLSDCSALSTITMPEGISSIETMYVINCDSITNVIIPVSTTDIRIKDCENFTSLYYTGSIQDWLSLNRIQMGYDAINIPYDLYIQNQKATDITIPSGLSINDYAFKNCTSLVSVSISNGIHNIGASAFDGCSNLKSVSIPSSVEKLGINAFRNCPLDAASFADTTKTWYKTENYNYTGGVTCGQMSSTDLRRNALMIRQSGYLFYCVN